MVLETCMTLCVTDQEKNFCHQNWKNGPKMGQKQGFLNLLKYLVISFIEFNL